MDSLLGNLLDCYKDHYTPFDEMTYRLMDNVIRCYNQELYDASVILCRGTIDSAIYLSCYFEKSQNGDFKIRNPSVLKPNNHVSWEDLRKNAINLKLLNKKELDDINKNVRELGNFAAHIGERQIKEGNDWIKNCSKYIKAVLQGESTGNIPENCREGYKISTTINEAESAIKNTIDFLKKLALKC